MGYLSLVLEPRFKQAVNSQAHSARNQLIMCEEGPEVIRAPPRSAAAAFMQRIIIEKAAITIYC